MKSVFRIQLTAARSFSSVKNPLSGIPKVRFLAPEVVPSRIKPAVTLVTGNAQDVLNYHVNQQIKAHQAHSIDTGSPAVQIAVLTERIISLAKHVAANKKDQSAKRGFAMIVHRRKRMMIYLRRTDFPTFEKTVIALGLQKEALSLPLKKK